MKMAGKVLIIDDEAVLRNTLTRILQKAGCETTAAMDGHEALQLLSDNVRFDLVYLDIHLPDFDGLQVLREIRSREPKLPVILLTGYGSLQSAVEALRLGAYDYLLKPFDPEILVARTRAVLQEQAMERRKEELRQQIAALQAELRALEADKERPAGDEQTVEPKPGRLVRSLPAPQDRFLKRGRLILDLQAQRATLGERVLSIPPSTFNYLAILVERSPDVVDYQTLVCEAQEYPRTAIDANQARELAKWHIHTLRRTLRADTPAGIASSCQILNVRGIGYRFLAD